VFVFSIISINTIDDFLPTICLCDGGAKLFVGPEILTDEDQGRIVGENGRDDFEFRLHQTLVF